MRVRACARPVGKTDSKRSPEYRTPLGKIRERKRTLGGVRSTAPLQGNTGTKTGTETTPTAAAHRRPAEKSK